MWGQVVIGAPGWIGVAAALVAAATAVLAWSYYRGGRVAGLTGGRLPALLLAAGLKFAGIAALAVCLVEPLFSGMRPRPGANVFGILVDTSQSMQIQDPGQSSSRHEQLQRTLRPKSAWRARLEQDFDVRGYTFSSRLERVEDFEQLRFDGMASGLATALDTVSQRFHTRPVAGLLLFSDGNDTSSADVAKDWKQLGFPVYPVVEPATDPPRDVRLLQVGISQSNFETAPITLSGDIASTGLQDERLAVWLEDETQAVVAEQTLDAPADGKLAAFRFRFRPEEPGLAFYRVHVCPESQRGRYARGRSTVEATLENNTRVVAVDRGGGPYRVLYVAGRPNWEFKFLRRALDADVEVELIGLVRIAREEPKFSFRDQKVTSKNPLFEGFDGKDEEEAERYDQPVLLRLGIREGEELRDGFPMTAAELFAYHAVIIDDLEAAFFRPEQLLLLRQFVAARGGGLLMLGGQESFREGGYDRTSLGELAPVYLDRATAEKGEGALRLELTREGWLQPWTRVRSTEVAEQRRLEEMPDFATYNPTGDIKPGAATLATVRDSGGDPRPALVTQRFGKGRSAAVLVGDMWRWAMHRPEEGPRDLEQAWRQTVRWLVSDVPRRVEVQVAEADGAESRMRIEVQVRDEEFQPLANAQVVLKGRTPDGESFELAAEPSDEQLGLYTASYWPRASGGYRVEAVATAEDGSEIERRETGWASQPGVEEFRDLEANRRLLEDLARQTGGEVITPDDLPTFVTDLPNRKVPVAEQWTYPLWHQPWLFGLAILCLCAEWGVRRWKGLP